MVEVKKISNTAKRQVTFACVYAPGHTVALAGVFNDWDSGNILMEYVADIRGYRCVLQLAPGSYEYKLVIDGEWVLDDSNPNFASNDFGTLNSVAVVE
ncbi:MAG: glycogen-binding domain-containing protein [Lentisphaeria bacterium]|nr:glycogen-binding domain-containing protein [Lentisphaeria bacterium]